MEDPQELLLAMAIAAHDSALEDLSEDGREVLEMVELAARGSEAPMSTTDAWIEARATADLSENDRAVLMAYVARMSLIEHFDKEIAAERGA